MMKKIHIVKKKSYNLNIVRKKNKYDMKMKNEKMKNTIIVERSKLLEEIKTNKILNQLNDKKKIRDQMKERLVETKLLNEIKNYFIIPKEDFDIKNWVVVDK